MIPGLQLGTGSGGFSGSSSAFSDTGAVQFGAFTFQPKGGDQLLWVALAAAAVVLVVLLVRR
ncbi:MAG: hypothetical protein ACREQZ_15725 [Woeseiaceae bacterium]